MLHSKEVREIMKAILRKRTMAQPRWESMVFEGQGVENEKIYN
jgi:hypothetical protein